MTEANNKKQDTCGCGHDHGHEEHKHEHKNEHDHGAKADVCGCGHDHGHEGHNHEHKHEHKHGGPNQKHDNSKRTDKKMRWMVMGVVVIGVIAALAYNFLA